MVISYYILKIPYTILWYFFRLFRNNLPIVFYCRDVNDWHIFAPIYKHLPHIKIVSDKTKTIEILCSMDVKVECMPVFPKVVIMCRHSTHKFPCKSILKIGMRHGAYHFKRLTKAESYNQFDIYFFTSTADLIAAEKIGVTVGKVTGYPKLDPAFDGTYNNTYLDNLEKGLRFDKNKTTILFSATWNKSGMSAIDLWYQRLSELTKIYNVIVTLHPWTDKKYFNYIDEIQNVFLIKNESIVPYIMLADVCIGDTSSIIAECSALNKPIITFKVDKAERTVEETIRLIEKVSYPISNFSQLIIAIEYIKKNKMELVEQRKQVNKIFFNNLDGTAGYQTAKEIKNIIDRY